jgi:class 3 adenylate cyclase
VSMRRFRSFGFLTLSRFAWYLHSSGDEAAASAAHEFREVVRRTLSTSGLPVRVHLWLGEALILVGTEVEPTVDAAIAIDRAYAATPHEIPIQGGLSCGDVLMLEGSDYVGEAVYMAVWLSGAAAPGELLVTAEVAQYVRPPAGFLPRGSTRVPGLPDDIDVFSLRTTVPPAIAG